MTDTNLTAGPLFLNDLFLLFSKKNSQIGLYYTRLLMVLLFFRLYDDLSFNLLHLLKIPRQIKEKKLTSTDHCCVLFSSFLGKRSGTQAGFPLRFVYKIRVFILVFLPKREMRLFCALPEKRKSADAV